MEKHQLFIFFSQSEKAITNYAAEQGAQLSSTAAAYEAGQPFCSERTVAHQPASSVSPDVAMAVASVMATGELVETKMAFLCLAASGWVACWRLSLCMLLHSVGPQSPSGCPEVTVTQTIWDKQSHGRAGTLRRGDIAHPLGISMSLSTASLSC